MADRVLIAGAGPVGLVAAANLVRHGVPLTVFEAGPDLSTESRASTFHPPTLDMLDDLGAAEPLIAQGLRAPEFQYRTKAGLIAQFDFGAISDATRHPYRLQCEQSRLTRILLEQLRENPNFAIEFDSPIREVTETSDGIEVTLDRGQTAERRRGAWLIGADGARSDVRRSLGIAFEGFTWPERYLVVSTPFEFRDVIDDLVWVNYVADPERWFFLLRTPSHWRVMFRIAAEESDELALSANFAQQLMSEILPGRSGCEIAHTTLYRVHQRVAESFRKGRAFIIGDAAHVNNPLGGMGMNGGIHDAMNLTDRLASVCGGSAPETELDRFAQQRRLITKEHVETQSIRNKKDLESPGPEFSERLRQISADPRRTYDFLLGVSMISSLRRAETIA